MVRPGHGVAEGGQRHRLGRRVADPPGHLHRRVRLDGPGFGGGGGAAHQREAGQGGGPQRAVASGKGAQGLLQQGDLGAVGDVDLEAARAHGEDRPDELVGPAGVARRPSRLSQGLPAGGQLAVQDLRFAEAPAGRDRVAGPAVEGPAVPAHGLLVAGLGHGGLGRLQGVDGGPLLSVGAPGPGPVEGQLGGAAGGERLGRAAVQVGQHRGAEVGIERLPDKIMGEAEAVVSGRHQPGLHRRLEERQDRVLRLAGHRPQQCDVGLSDHRRRPQQFRGRLGEAGHPPAQHVADAGRDVEGVVLAGAAPHGVEAGDLGDEERVAARSPVEAGQPPPGRRQPGAGDVLDERGRRLLVEATQSQAQDGRGQIGEGRGDVVGPVERVVPGGEDEQEAQPGQDADEEPQQGQGGGVGPVDVFQNDGGGPGLRPRLQRVGDGGEDLRAARSFPGE